MKCKLCRRDAVSDLCPYHQAARDSLETAYQLWVRAHGTFEWVEYLDNVKRNAQTGQWAREIAELLGGV